MPSQWKLCASRSSSVEQAGLLSCRLLPFRVIYWSKSISHRPSWLDCCSLTLCLVVCVLRGPFVSFHLYCTLLRFRQTCSHLTIVNLKVAFICKTYQMFCTDQTSQSLNSWTVHTPCTYQRSGSWWMDEWVRNHNAGYKLFAAERLRRHVHDMHCTRLFAAAPKIAVKPCRKEWMHNNELYLFIYLLLLLLLNIAALCFKWPHDTTHFIDWLHRVRLQLTTHS